MRVPLVYTATELANWTIAEEFKPGRWRPARCCGFEGFRYFKMRCKISWAVFTGKLDAINWEGSGELTNKDINYRDCTHPEFKLSK